jgi:hypothetical protein
LLRGATVLVVVRVRLILVLLALRADTARLVVLDHILMLAVAVLALALTFVLVGFPGQVNTIADVVIQPGDVVVGDDARHRLGQIHTLAIVHLEVVLSVAASGFGASRGFVPPFVGLLLVPLVDEHQQHHAVSFVTSRKAGIVSILH